MTKYYEYLDNILNITAFQNDRRIASGVLILHTDWCRGKVLFSETKLILTDEQEMLYTGIGPQVLTALSTLDIGNAESKVPFELDYQL